MINLTVKTLDSQNRSFSVPDTYTVEQFKQHIAESVSIPVESQRLIYCGRVLDDEKNLTDYNLDGKVVHLVERLPPSRLGPSSNADGSSDNASNRSTRDSRPDRLRPSALRRNRIASIASQANGGNAMYLGAMAFDDLMDAQALHIPQLAGRRLLQSRFDLANYMAEQLDQVVHRLEQASNPEQESAPEQPSAPPETAPQSSENNSNGHDSMDFPSFLVHATVAGAFGGEATVEVEIRPETDDQSQEGVTRNEAADSQNTNASSASGSNSAPSAATENENQSSSSNSQRRPQSTPANLGALLQRIEGINERFRPFLRQYTDVMLNDPTLPATGENSVESTQRIIDGVSEALHFQGHLQHALSDLMFDLSERPPRSLRCRQLVIQQPTVFQSSIPIQAVIPTRNPPSTQSQNAAAAEDNREDEDSTDREMEIEVDGTENAEAEQTSNTTEPAAQFTPSPETQPSESAATNTSATTSTSTSGQNQNQTGSSSSNSSNSFRRSRANFPNTAGRTGGRRSGLSSLIQNLTSCFDPFLPCNSHHIRERRRNYFFPPGAAIGRITAVTTAIPATATVEVTTSTESQTSQQQQNQASGNQGGQEGSAAQGGSAESDQNAQGNRSVRLRFFEDAMSRLNSSLQFNRGSTSANGTQSGNGGSRPRAQAFIGMSPIVEMISEPVINLVANSDGQSRVIRLPAGNYASMFSEMATEMANAVSQAAASASSQANQSLLSSLLQITSESISFDDLVTSQNGNLSLLNVFSRLQSFIQRRIPSLGTYQPSSTSASDLILNSYHLPVFRRPVREVLLELEESVKQLLENVAMRNERVDVISSVMNVIEVELYMFLGILVYSPDSRSFQRMIYCEIEHFARKLFHVLFNCCQQGLEGVHQIAQAFISQIMSSNLSQYLKMWIVHATIFFLRANLIINPEQSDLFVVHQRSGEEGTSNSSSSSATGDSSHQSSSTSPTAPPTTSESSSSESGSSLMNLMQIISQNVSLGDAVRLSCGINVSLANVGRQLEDFLRRRFPSVRELQRGQWIIDIVRNSYGMAQFRSPVRELYSELRASVVSTLSYAEMREGVDAVAAVMDVIESRLYVFLGALFLSPDWEQFEVMIRSELNLLVRDLITTVYNCCSRSREGLLQVSQAMLSGVMRSSIPQPLKMWVTYSTISYLRTMLSSNMQRSSETVKERAALQSTANTSTTGSSALDLRRETPPTPASAQVNDVPAPASPRSAPSPELMDSDSMEAELPPLNSSLPNEPLPEVSIGSEDWHNHLRRQDLGEWVPIITRDAQYQRRQSPQRPFSDAYLSGMPNKRRRLITATKPQSGRVSQFISESLERAITTADVGTSAVTNAVVQHAAVDPALRSAYVQQLRSRTDLSSNPDFNPSKYPNANNYFKKT